VHRDIKLENILLNPLNFEPILGDFGCANSISQNYIQIGTRGFMAPEVMKGIKTKDVGKCDVFSIGIVAFIMLFGFEPFSHSYSGYWFTLIKMNKWKDFWQDRIVSDQFKDFFQSMINFDDENRFTI